MLVVNEEILNRSETCEKIHKITNEKQFTLFVGKHTQNATCFQLVFLALESS